MQKNNSNPFDGRTILAIVLVMLIFMGWQKYMTTKYPNKNLTQNQQVDKTQSQPTSSLDTVTTRQNLGVEQKSDSQVQTPEVEMKYEDEFRKFSVSSVGMGIKNFSLKKYTDNEKNPILVGHPNQSLFSVSIPSVGEQIHFQLSETQKGEYIGTAIIGEMKVERKLKFDSQSASFTSETKITQPTEALLKGIEFQVPEQIKVPKSSSIFFPSYEHQDFTVFHSGKVEAINFSSSKEDLTKTLTQANMLGVGTQYFASLFIDQSDFIPEVYLHANIKDSVALAKIIYKPTQLKPEIIIQQKYYAGEKTSEALSKIDTQLTQMIDYGFFTMIARPMVNVMKFFHSIVGNWGFAIILLTLLVRLLVLPFNIYSFKSMKAMQKVQPMVNQLRERYKDDPMALNREMMTLMKQNGANPLGGCLPMLLQIPIFFALYRMIGSSVELYQSPFLFWITDLSSHDRFYILPIAVAIAMFIQQKLTPTNADPSMQKMLLIMPLVFAAFMLQMPSGLSLYMLVSTLFGIIQQYLILREKKA